MNDLAITPKGTSVLAAQDVDYVKVAGEYLAAMGTNLDDKQKTQFIQICSAYGLNPFKREIYGVAYNGKQGQTFNIIVGYEVYLKRAERSGKLDGWKVSIEGVGAEMKAVIEIHRKDWRMPFTHEVYLSEASSGQAIWQKQPKFMLKKVAIGQGFRLCFPDELGGLPYLDEEIPREQPQQQQQLKPAPRVMEQTIAEPQEKIIIGEPVNKDFFNI